MHSVKALTIRNVDPELARALERERLRRGASLNATVLQLLRQALGVEPDVVRSNGLRRLAGTWSAEELEAFAADTAVFEQVDEELWR
jgi:plasmid stability protein